MTDNEWLTRMGLCHRCRKEKAAPDRKFCFDCLDKIREENAGRYDSGKAKEYQTRRRELYREKKENGICVRCSRKAVRGIYCSECSVKVKRHNRRTAERRRLERHETGLIPEKRKEGGMCLWCGKPALRGMQCCAEHQKIFSAAGIRGYKANLINKNNPWVNETEVWKKKNSLKKAGKQNG